MFFWRVTPFSLVCVYKHTVEHTTTIVRLHTSPAGTVTVNPLNAELNPICHLLVLLGAHHIRHFSRIRVNTESKKWGAGVDWLEFTK